MKAQIKKLSPEQKAYITGFLEGDGSILVQIVKRDDYRMKFQIRFSVVFYQKTTSHWFLLKLQKQIGVGSIRKRKDGMSEYAIVGIQNVSHILLELFPYFQLKKKYIQLVLHIIKATQKVETETDFLHVCELVDQTISYTYSKKRTITALVVRERLKL